MHIKTIAKSFGRFISIFLLGMLISLTASSLMDIYYFFIRLKYTSGLDNLKLWIVGGAIVGVLAGVISSILALRTNKQPKDFQLFSLIFLKVFITSIITLAFVLMVWNYYKFDYFRLKDAGPAGLLTGLILGLIDLLNHIPIGANKEK